MREIAGRAGDARRGRRGRPRGRPQPGQRALRRWCRTRHGAEPGKRDGARDGVTSEEERLGAQGTWFCEFGVGAFLRCSCFLALSGGLSPPALPLSPGLFPLLALPEKKKKKKKAGLRGGRRFKGPLGRPPAGSVAPGRPRARRSGATLGASRPCDLWPTLESPRPRAVRGRGRWRCVGLGRGGGRGDSERLRERRQTERRQTVLSPGERHRRAAESRRRALLDVQPLSR